ncbi:MAG: hypothetical protein KatS3mg027_0516 [Bacteroidia bacterium]|nr:MAG: hypothetical protein KatS3mg027_0516 [Bacteroidia bacterium]
MSTIAAMAALTASAQPCTWGLQQITQAPINPFTIAFTPQTTAPPPNSVVYIWNFGDGNYGSTVSYSSTAVHPYCNPGTYTVTVFATDSLNPSCSFSMQTVATVTASPFSITSINVDASADPVISFTANVNNPYGLSLTYSWDFNYPNNWLGSGNTVSHNYNNQGNGTYPVRVDVSGGGCTKYDTTSVTVNNANPCWGFPNITITSNNDPSFTFSVSVNPAPSNYATYTWSFGDGNQTTTTSNSVSYTYSNNGSYYACVFINDSLATCSYSGACVPVNVSNAGGGPGGGNGTLTCSLSISFTQDSLNPQVWYYNYSGISSDPNASVSYYWTFGDGNTSTQAFPTHTYSAPGNYSVCLTITYTDSTDTCIVSNCGYITNAQYLYKVGTPLGVHLTNYKPTLVLYPNPANDVLYIQSNNNNINNSTIQILDLTGREIKHIKSNNTSRIEINISDLKEGLYFIRYNDINEIEITQPFIKN